MPTPNPEGAGGRPLASQKQGEFLEDDKQSVGTATTNTVTTEPIFVDDVDVVRFYGVFTSSAADVTGQVLFHIETSPDGETFETGEAWELPYTISASGANVPLHIPFETDGVGWIRVSAVQNTSASASVTEAYLIWRKGRIKGA